MSDTPQQALTLLNDPSFVEAARAFATQLLAANDKTDAQRLDMAYERALARVPRPAERDSLLKFLDGQRAQYRDDQDSATKLIKIGNSTPPKDDSAPELAAWTQVCRVILNLHETITRY